MPDETTPDPLQEELDAAAAEVEATMASDGDAPAADSTDGAPDGSADDTPAEAIDDAPEAADDADEPLPEPPPAESPAGPSAMDQVRELIRTRPRLVLGALGGFLLFILIVRMTACGPPPPEEAFWGKTGAAYGTLSISAQRTAGALATAADRADMITVRRVAENQLKTVERVSRKLDGLEHVSTEEIPLRNAMIEAVAAQRDFLEQLVRVTSGTPARAAQGLGDLAESAEAMEKAWEKFLELDHHAPPSLLHTGLPYKVREFARALGVEPPPAPTKKPHGAAGHTATARGATAERRPPRNAAEAIASAGFRAGTVACRGLGGNGVICESRGGTAVQMYADDAPVVVSAPRKSPLGAGYPPASSWSNYGGGVTCTAAQGQVQCENIAGLGFRLSRSGMTQLR